MTPEEIKKLLLQSKADGLSGATMRQLQATVAQPNWQKQVQKKQVQSDLATQATTGLQQTMGPLAALMPSMGLFMDAAPAAIGVGSELGEAYKQGYVSNQNFDNTMLGMLGFSSIPLMGRKGEGKLYSKALTKAEEQGVDLQNATPTFLKRWFNKNDIKPEERKYVEHWIADEAPPLTGNVHGETLDSFARRELERNGYPAPAQTISQTWKDVSFPEITAAMKDHGVADVNRDHMQVQNLLYQTPDDINALQREVMRSK